jgi:hypothetical protein
VDSSNGVVRALLWALSNGTIVFGAGLALTGLGLVAAIGPEILRQPWLLVALRSTFGNLALAFFIQRPGSPPPWASGPRTIAPGGNGPGGSATCRT